MASRIFSTTAIPVINTRPLCHILQLVPPSFSIVQAGQDQNKGCALNYNFLGHSNTLIILISSHSARSQFFPTKCAIVGVLLFEQCHNAMAPDQTLNRSRCIVPYYPAVSIHHYATTPPLIEYQTSILYFQRIITNTELPIPRIQNFVF